MDGKDGMSRRLAAKEFFSGPLDNMVCAQKRACWLRKKSNAKRGGMW